MLLKKIHRTLRNRFLQVSYEKLIMHPQDSIGQIGRFLKFKRAQKTVTGRYVIPSRYTSIHRHVFKSPLPGRIRAWRNDLSLADIKEFEQLAGPILKKNGYPLVFSKKTHLSRKGEIETPTRVRLEAASICQLRCPLCHQTTVHPHQTNALKQEQLLPRGLLSLYNFKAFIHHNPHVKEIELSNNGEVFLNPSLNKILEYAYYKNITITLDNGVNLNTVTQEQLEALVKYQVKRITVSIDGPTQSIYKKYRIQGNLKTVFRNIKIIQSIKNKAGSDYPYLTWQAIGFRYNEQHLKKMQAIATSLGMQFFVKYNHTPGYAPLINNNIPAQYQGYHSYAEYLSKKTYSPCHMTFLEPQINWDGTLLGCCINSWKGIGNVFSHGLEYCMNTPSYRHMIAIAKRQVTPNTDSPCIQCDIVSPRCSSGNSK